MSKSNQLSTKAILAGAVLLSLTACANRPIVNPDSRLVDGTDAYAEPEQTAEATTAVESSADFKDEVDLVLIDDDLKKKMEIERKKFETGPGLNKDIAVSAVGESRAKQLDSELPPTIEIVAVARPSQNELGENELQELVPENSSDQAELVATKEVVQYDLEYEVKASESLWDISKQLTGDATNWQQLAALNNLDASGAIFGGQKLLIPGDMLKPEHHAPDKVAPKTNEIDLSKTASARLDVPSATAVEAVSKVVMSETPNDSVIQRPALDLGPTTSVKVQAGETMWDLAKRTTGDATNWTQIAAVNGMSEQEAALIKYGQSLDIPQSLLKATTTDSTKSATQATTVEVTSAKATEEVADEVAKVEQVVAEAKAVESEEELKILPAKYQTETTTQKPQHTPVVAAAKPESSEDWVMVSGTYYPKAVYNDANFSATLLTRVSPGTKLQVSRAIGPWFEVKTDRGLGYVHSRDIK